MKLFSVLLTISCLPLTLQAQNRYPKPILVSVEKIWDKAPHNGFTDLVRYKDRWYCTFREGEGHASNDGILKIIASDDGEKWELAASIESTRGWDMREAKFAIMPDGRLMLTGAEANRKTKPTQHQSLVWLTSDGTNWTKTKNIADPDFWLWRGAWHKGKGYYFGYKTGAGTRAIRFYGTVDGEKFDMIADDVFPDQPKGYPNETTVKFLKDGTCLCLLRRDGGRDLNSAQLGIAKPPYKDWKWKDLGVRIGGPNMLQLPDGNWVAVIRRYGEGKMQVKDWYNSVHWLDPEKGTLKEVLKLPFTGDSGYTGMVWHDGLLWVSNYSSHEEGTNVYLAKIKFEGMRTAKKTADSGAVQPEGFRQAGILSAWKKHANTLTFGKGQTLALVDDGCKLSKPEWNTKSDGVPKVRVSYDAVDGDDDPKHEGRGYHGSTIGIPSSLNYRGKKGVAFNNQLAMIRSLECCHCKTADSVTLAKALQWVLDHHEKYDITTVNLSPVDDQAHAAPVKTEIDGKLRELRKQNIWVSAPAGNHGFTKGISWPACQPDCFAIGAVKPGEDLVILDRQKKIDLLVPAAATSSSNAILCGSSMILREAIKKADFKWDAEGTTLPEAMMTIFQKTGKTVADPGTGLSFKRLNLLAALDYVSK